MIMLGDGFLGAFGALGSLAWICPYPLFTIESLCCTNASFVIPKMCFVCSYRQQEIHV
jgi:hypothetical protein